MIRTCRQCFEEYVAGPARTDDGFCSDPCEQQYDKEIGRSAFEFECDDD